jgi:hypothetical protein
VDERIGRLSAVLGGTARTIGVRPVGRDGASLRTERITVQSATIDVKFLSWSPLTAASKEAMAYDRATANGGEYPYVRAALNRELKYGLVNDCLTDVVTYGGPSGSTIRHAAEEAVCDTLGGRYDGEDCDIAREEVPGALAFITESLGSKLLFDAILEVWADGENSGDRHMKERVAHGLAATRMMYLMANQLALLDHAGPAAGRGGAAAARPTTGRTTGDVFDLLAGLHRQAPSGTPPLTLVAFSDPNDLLSYRIVPRHLGRVSKDVRVVNVVVSNDTTYFNYVERPDNAHCGYSGNPHVLGMVARGYRAGKRQPEYPVLETRTCPDFITIDREPTTSPVVGAAADGK